MKKRTRLNEIESVGKEYKYFGEFLENKDIVSNDDLIRAFFHEIKNFKEEMSIDFELNDRLVNQEASDILFLIKNIINKRKKDKTLLFVGALKYITGSSKWDDINYPVFNELIENIKPELFLESPLNALEELETLPVFDKLGEDDIKKFLKYLILKIIYTLCQKSKSPLVLSNYIEEGMFKKGSKVEIISKRVFRKYIDLIDGEDEDLNLLVEIIEKYSLIPDKFLEYVSTHKIDDYKSTHILKLKKTDNLAILIPKYEQIDYESIEKKVNTELESKNYERVAKNVSLEKIILFYYLVIKLNEENKTKHFNISSQKFSSYIGEPKIVNIICDVLEEENIFKDKKEALAELRSKSYKLTFDVEEDGFHALSDPILIYKLNSERKLKSGLPSDNKLLFFEEIINIIEYRSKDEKINLTKIFLDSMLTTHLKNLLVIIVSLKYRIFDSNRVGKYADYVNAFNSIDKQSAITLYNCFFKRIYLFSRNFEEANFINSSIPSLPELISIESAEKVALKKYSSDYISKNPKNIKDKIEKYIEKDKRKKYKKYVSELNKFC